MNISLFNKQLMIIAGPCSIDEHNIEDIYQISRIKVMNRFGRKERAIHGTRVVGLKSRTTLSKDGKNMGIDFKVFMENMQILIDGKAIHQLKLFPTARIAKTIIKETGLLVATEIMSPIIQLPVYEKHLPKGKLLIWNPSVEQLGWPILKMGAFAKRNHWYIGLKNPKWFGDDTVGQTTMEKTWIGLTDYTTMKDPGLDDRVILIHRGVDVYNKGDYRNLPVHQAAKRVKESTRVKLFFDPSHIHGPKLRDSIVNATVETMKIKIDEERYLYDGILIEAGRSKTDTEQHITVKELESMCHQLTEFRNLIPPEN